MVAVEFPECINRSLLPTMLAAYNDWKLSNRLAWPFGGTRLSQPKWVTLYFDVFDAVAEIVELEKRRADVSALPSREQALGRGAPPTA